MGDTRNKRSQEHTEIVALIDKEEQTKRLAGTFRTVELFGIKKPTKTIDTEMHAGSKTGCEKEQYVTKEQIN